MINEIHEHDWRVLAYFCSTGEENEWIVLECKVCFEKRVVQGRDMRNYGV